LNVDRSGDGTPDTARIVAMIDVGGLNPSGQPTNEWRTTLDVEIPFTEVGLKSPATPYVATIGHSEEAQATLRIDGQGSGYEYKFVTYRRLEKVVTPSRSGPKTRNSEGVANRGGRLEPAPAGRRRADGRK
jgi:hypothetical protein